MLTNVVTLALLMIDQRINSAVYVVMLREAMNFPLCISPSEEIGDLTINVREKLLTLSETEPTTSRFYYYCSTDQL